MVDERRDPGLQHVSVLVEIIPPVEIRARVASHPPAALAIIADRVDLVGHAVAPPVEGVIEVQGRQRRLQPQVGLAVHRFAADLGDPAGILDRRRVRAEPAYAQQRVQRRVLRSRVAPLAPAHAGEMHVGPDAAAADVGIGRPVPVVVDRGEADPAGALERRLGGDKRLRDVAEEWIAANRATLRALLHEARRVELLAGLRIWRHSPAA